VARRSAALHRDLPKLDRPRYLGAPWRRRAAAAHRVRERLEPAARTRERPPARNDGPGRARREPPAPDPAVAD
jgi:hypothetical protein